MSVDYEPICGIGAHLTSEDIEKLSKLSPKENDLDEIINGFKERNPKEYHKYFIQNYGSAYSGVYKYCITIKDILADIDFIPSKIKELTRLLEGYEIKAQIVEIEELLIY